MTLNQKMSLKTLRKCDIEPEDVAEDLEKM